MSEKQRNLIFHFAILRMPNSKSYRERTGATASVEEIEQELFASLDVDLIKSPEYVGLLLREALLSQDSGDVEVALILMFIYGYQDSFFLTLIDLLKAPWHQRHEDILSKLQELRDPRAVDALYEAAFVTFPYRDYDENEGLARRCTWALADIGTTEAHYKLELLAATNNELIAAYAQKRLDRWESEALRKGQR